MNTVLARLDALSRRPWFGDALVLAGAAAILVAAMVMSPSPGVLTLFGIDVPVVCGFRRLTGIGCPGCGLTRSFVFLGHGEPLEAFRMNWLGPPLFALVAGQIPYRLYRIAKVRGGTA